MQNAICVVAAAKSTRREGQDSSPAPRLLGAGRPPSPEVVFSASKFRHLSLPLAFELEGWHASEVCAFCQEQRRHRMTIHLQQDMGTARHRCLRLGRSRWRLREAPTARNQLAGVEMQQRQSWGSPSRKKCESPGTGACSKLQCWRNETCVDGRENLGEERELLSSA